MTLYGERPTTINVNVREIVSLLSQPSPARDGREASMDDYLRHLRTMREDSSTTEPAAEISEIDRVREQRDDLREGIDRALRIILDMEDMPKMLFEVRETLRAAVELVDRDN